MKTTCIVLAAMVLIGCATAHRMNSLSVGMTKQEVFGVMGNPSSTAATGNVEVLRYKLAPTDDDAWYGNTEEYFVKLLDGKVESYGRMGDFNSTKDPAINLNINK